MYQEFDFLQNIKHYIFYLSDKVSCDSLHVRVVSSWVSISVSASGSTSSVFIKPISHLEHIEN